ncbi:hypothetical protein [Nocardioides sp. YIM 152588]|uniref:hypothetical protein n=1 Tax=Nocardioides sp. YIM 152588 TaxID=3158259 RepID=UPI0032E39384
MLRGRGDLVRRRPLRALLVGVAVVLVGSGLSAPAAVADAEVEPRLPSAVNAPGAWSEPRVPREPVAALGVATRTMPVGLRDSRDRLAFFWTSALDGRSSWLDAGFWPNDWSLEGGVAVSPDGRWLAWVRPAKARGREGLGGLGAPLAGWSVLDTTTGRVRDLAVPGFDRVRPTFSDLAFSRDSRYLLTSYETPDRPRNGNRGHRFVAWDAADGSPHVLEEPGHYWLPTLGYADSGVVWSRGHRVFRADPATGDRATVTLPRKVSLASFAPGDAGFAYLGPDDRLYVGATSAAATRAIGLPDSSPVGEFLAWRDATHVVLGNYRREVYVVDTTDGGVETIDLAGSGDQVNTPVLALDLWAEPLRDPVAPVGTSDPRRPWRWVGLGVFVGLLAGGAVLLRRADRTAGRRRPQPAAERRRVRA